MSSLWKRRGQSREQRLAAIAAMQIYSLTLPCVRVLPSPEYAVVCGLSNRVLMLKRHVDLVHPDLGIIYVGIGIRHVEIRHILHA